MTDSSGLLIRLPPSTDSLSTASFTDERRSAELSPGRYRRGSSSSIASSSSSISHGRPSHDGLARPQPVHLKSLPPEELTEHHRRQRKGKQRARDESLDLSAAAAAADDASRPVMLEDMLANAMKTSIVLPLAKSTGTVGNTMPSAAAAARNSSGTVRRLSSQFSPSHVTISRPVSLVHAPKRRRSAAKSVQQMQRRRSTSAALPHDANAMDPLAWLRQTVQEQRAEVDPRLPLRKSTGSRDEYDSSIAVSMPRPSTHSRTASAASIKSATGSPPSPIPSKKFDYSGASLLSFFAGQGAVQKRVQDHARQSSIDSVTSSPRSSLSSPTMPSQPNFSQQMSESHPAVAALEAAAAGETPDTAAETQRARGLKAFNLSSLPSMPSASLPKLPQMPNLSTPTLPSLPSLQVPNISLPRFNTPELPDMRGWMPEQLARGLGVSTGGENPSKKFMNEDDQTAEDEPDWARIKDKYEKPRLPLVFLHGLFGFSVIGPANVPALQIQYWRGVREALEELGVEVLMTSSPASGNIETRAKAVAEQIHERFEGREINIIGHSMGGLDARYMITHLAPLSFTVRSMTSIATPHGGSPFADFLLDDVLGRQNLPSLLALMKVLQMPGGGRAFEALTTSKMARFNDETPNDPEVQYYSYGAQFRPSYLDVFRLPWSVIFEKEGENDGLVSVESAQWGDYQGTLENVNHLDLVGWVGRVRYAFAEMSGKAIKFKPVSFYLSIAERLAEAGY